MKENTRCSVRMHVGAVRTRALSERNRRAWPHEQAAGRIPHERHGAHATLQPRGQPAYYVCCNGTRSHRYQCG